MKKLFILSSVFAVLFMLATSVDAQTRRRSSRRTTTDQTVEEGTARARAGSSRRRSARSARSGSKRTTRATAEGQATTGRRSSRRRSGRSSGARSARRAKGGVRSAPTGRSAARTATVGVANTSTFAVEEGVEAAIESEATTGQETAPVQIKKSYAVDLDALKAGSNSIKACQDNMLTCVNNMLPDDKGKSVGLGLCYLSGKRYAFDDKEKTLRNLERKLFQMMGNAGFAKLDPKEQAIYKNLDMQFEAEAEEGEEEEGDSITAMMAEMDKQMASIDAIANYDGREATPKELFEEAFTTCKAVVDTCESVLGEQSLQKFVRAKADFACRTYDKALQDKYRKQTLMLTQVKAKMKGDYLKTRRKNMLSMQQGFIEIEKQLEGSICGKGLKECLYCGANQTDEAACSAELVQKLEDQKPVVSDLLDKISYGEPERGEAVWRAFIQNKKTTIDRFARMANYSAKEAATRGLADATKQYRKEFSKCLSDVCGDDLIACADVNVIKAGFDGLKRTKPITYTVMTEKGQAEERTVPLQEFSFNNLVEATVDFNEANSACRDGVDLFANELRLLNENPNVDKALLPWNRGGQDDYVSDDEWETKGIEKLNQYADGIFRKTHSVIKAKATQALEENRVQLMDKQLAFLAKRIEGYKANRAAEVAVVDADKEAGIKMREKDVEVLKRDVAAQKTRHKAETDLLQSMTTKQEKKAALTKKLDKLIRARAIEISKSEEDPSAQKRRLAIMGEAKQVVFGKLCKDWGGTYDEDKKACKLYFKARKNNRKSRGRDLYVTENNGADISCTHATFGIKPKKGCSGPLGTHKGHSAASNWKYPSLLEEASKKGLMTSEGELDPQTDAAKGELINLGVDVEKFIPVVTEEHMAKARAEIEGKEEEEEEE